MASTPRRRPPSATQEVPTSPPRLIPGNDMVILRENELDCDLTTAIQRVREDARTAGSRILIVAPDREPEPAPQPPAAELPLPALPMSIGQVARSGGESALRQGGAELTPKLRSMQKLFEELHHGLDDLEEAAAEGSRAQLSRQVRVLREMVAWIESTGEDLERDLATMAEGFRQLDAVELCREIQGQVESFFPGLRVNVEVPSGELTCRGKATELAECLFLAGVLTAHRIGGQGSVNFQFEAQGGRLEIRVLGLGEPRQVAAPEVTRRFRDIVAAHGGHVVPDAMGPNGTGFVIDLPAGADPA